VTDVISNRAFSSPTMQCPYPIGDPGGIAMVCNYVIKYVCLQKMEKNGVELKDHSFREVIPKKYIYLKYATTI